MERWLPGAARVWRSTRDALAFRFARTRVLRDGTRLAGGAALADPTFEADERRIVADALETTDVFVDVGANVGLYTVLARARGVRVVAVEPHPRNCAYLRRSIAANGWRDVEIQAVAVGRDATTAVLYGRDTGASLVRGWAGVSAIDAQRVDVTTLDALLARRFDGQRLFVKLDIEGGEYDALLGARAVLHRVPRPRWLVEITLTENRAARNPHFAQIFDLFFEAGYRAFAVERELREIARADVLAWSESARNFLFV